MTTEPRSTVLGSFIRDQRHQAELSVRRLAELAGVSNPYLSQIERGLKRPSAEILQQLARALEISSESLYVQAGLLDDEKRSEQAAATVVHAIDADEALSVAQKSSLVEIYRSFVGDGVDEAAETEPVD
ncbi:MAG: helix-turn-helix transcriptional regulator [Acidobacteria bacterium]|nr:helix-turn-helix transcriptional regulator [Acidobacteriota bacterium]